MPVTILGPLQINNITTSALVKFGDSFALTPKNVSEASAGAGGFNAAVLVMTNTAVNSTNYIDPNVIDQPIAGNN